MTEVALRDAPITITTLERLIGTPTIPKRYTSVGDMLATVLMGRELGVAEMTSLKEIYLIDGTASMSAKLMLALIFGAGHKVKITLTRADDGTWDRAECHAWRKVDDEFEDFGTFEFTIDDAERAGLMGKSNWENYPQWMMASRALTATARFVFPDVVLGVGYVPEEVGVTGPVPTPLPEGITEIIDGEIVEDDDVIDIEEAADLLDAEIVE
jgi:hypothetical protein